MKGIFLKKALSLSLLISMSAPMLAVDNESGLIASVKKAGRSAYGLFSKSTEVATVQTPATPVDVPTFPVLNVDKPVVEIVEVPVVVAPWYSRAYNTAMDYTLRPAYEYAVKPAYNGVASATSYVWSNVSDNRVVNPVAAQAKQHPYIAAGIVTAAVVGTGLAIAYKKGKLSKPSWLRMPSMPSFGKNNSASTQEQKAAKEASVTADAKKATAKAYVRNQNDTTKAAFLAAFPQYIGSQHLYTQALGEAGE